MIGFIWPCYSHTRSVDDSHLISIRSVRVIRSKSEEDESHQLVYTVYSLIRLIHSVPRKVARAVVQRHLYRLAATWMTSKARGHFVFFLEQVKKNAVARYRTISSDFGLLKKTAPASLLFQFTYSSSILILLQQLFLFNLLLASPSCSSTFCPALVFFMYGIWPMSLVPRFYTQTKKAKVCAATRSPRSRIKHSGMCCCCGITFPLIQGSFVVPIRCLALTITAMLYMTLSAVLLAALNEPAPMIILLPGKTRVFVAASAYRRSIKSMACRFFILWSDLRFGFISFVDFASGCAEISVMRTTPRYAASDGAAL